MTDRPIPSSEGSPERVNPRQILARLFHEQRAFGQGDPERDCGDSCTLSAEDAFDALHANGWIIRDAPVSSEGSEPTLRDALEALVKEAEYALMQVKYTLGPLIRTHPAIKGSPMALEVRLTEALEAARRALAAASPPGEPTLRAWMQRIVAEGHVAPRTVADHEWPARCWDCGFTTEDPDAYAGDDEEQMPDGTLCPVTATFHRWVPAGTVRYLPADFLAALAAPAAPPVLPSVDRETLRAALTKTGFTLWDNDSGYVLYDDELDAVVAELARLVSTSDGTQK